MLLPGKHDQERLGDLLLYVISEAAGPAGPSIHGVLVMGHEVTASWALLVLELDLSFGCVKIIELRSPRFVFLLSGRLLTH